MKTKTLTLLALATFAGASFAPLAAQAQTVGLTGDIGAHLDAGENASSSNGGTAHADANVTVTAETAPIVITQDRAASAKDDSTSSGNTHDEAMANTDPASIDSSTALTSHAKAVVASDTDIQSLSLSSEKVSMSYREPARLFGMIHMNVAVTVTVDKDGTTHVSYPWYNFLLSSDEAGLSIRTQAAVNTALTGTHAVTAATSTSASSALSIQTQAQLLDSIHSAFKSTASASTSAEMQ